MTQAHDTLLNLASYTHAGLEDWLRQYSVVPARLAECLLADTSQLSL